MSTRKTPAKSFALWERELDQRGLRELLAETTKIHGALLAEVWSESRLRHVAAARRACIVAVSARFPHMSAWGIAAVMLVDRATVLEALKRSNAAGEGSHGGQAG
jgi:hypothetical protein